MEHLTVHAELLRECFRRTMAAKPFCILAISVLPDHLHMVIKLPEGDCDYSNRISSIKRNFSKNLPEAVKEFRMNTRRQERGIWQRGFWEHTIQDRADLDLHVGYCHYDPVRHGHAKTATDWALSSVHRNVRSGGIVGKLCPVHPRNRIKFGERLSVDRIPDPV